MGPELPAILISLDCNDSVKPPHFPPPGRDTHNKQLMTSARVTARGAAHLHRSRSTGAASHKKEQRQPAPAGIITALGLRCAAEQCLAKS